MPDTSEIKSLLMVCLDGDCDVAIEKRGSISGFIEAELYGIRGPSLHEKEDIRICCFELLQTYVPKRIDRALTHLYYLDLADVYRPTNALNTICCFLDFWPYNTSVLSYEGIMTNIDVCEVAVWKLEDLGRYSSSDVEPVRSMLRTLFDKADSPKVKLLAASVLQKNEWQDAQSRAVTKLLDTHDLWSWYEGVLRSSPEKYRALVDVGRTKNSVNEAEKADLGEETEDFISRMEQGL